MTDGPRGGTMPPNPDPERIFPESMRDTLDSGSMTFPAENDWEGVPIPSGFQFIAASSEWSRRLEAEGATPQLITDIGTGFREREERYPDSPIWDRMRAHHARQFLDAGHLHTSLDLIHGMRSRHAIADAVVGLAVDQEGDETSALILDGFIRRFQGMEDRDRLLGVVQALIDRTIDEDPYGPSIESFQGLLSSSIPGYDPVQAWADSQKELLPGVDWNGMVTWVRNEAAWQGVPVPYRQHAMKLHYNMQKVLAEEPSTELVESMVAGLRAAQEEYPDARAWDEFRIALGESLLALGYPSFALDFGRAMQGAHYQQALVVNFIDKGAEEEALELANAIADPARMAETLLFADWRDDKGAERLAAIVQDDNYPVLRRIACLEVIRDRMSEMGNAAGAAKHDARIAELRQQLDSSAG